MYNRRLFIKGLLVVSVAGMLCGFAWAAQQSGQTDPNKPAQGDQASSQSTVGQTSSQPGAATAGQAATQPGAGTAGQMGQQPMQLAKSSELIGKKLKNPQTNDDLGTIHDLVLTPDYQQASYAALSHGGTLGTGSKLFAIPWAAIKVAPDGTATANITKQTLDQANGFSDNNWPSQGDSRWLSASTASSAAGMSSAGTAASSAGQSAQAAGSQTSTSSTNASQDPNRTMTRDMNRGTTTGQTAMGTSNTDVQNHRVSKLTGMSVRNPQNEDIGDIEDFVIDAPNGHVAYTIVSFGGFWGIGEKYAAIPTAAVDFQPQQGIARVNADRQALESVAFDSSKWPDLTSREYAQRLRQVFKEEPYRATLGYVSPGQQPPQVSSQQAWGAQSDYVKHFDPNHITTIKGTVQSVGTFQPAKGVSEGLRLRVKTSDGNTVTVHAGPTWYAQQQNFSLRPGDDVTITGSNTKISWRSVFVASEIQKGNQTLQLRSKTGQPLWLKSQPGQAGQTPGSQSSTTTPGMSSQGQTGQAGQSSQSGQRRNRTRQP